MFWYNLLLILYIEIFRLFFFVKYNVLIIKGLNCEKLYIIFFWWCDYVVYLWNLRGIISWKVKNEKELEDLVYKLDLNYFIVSL